AAIASARLRWAISSARPLIAALDGGAPGEAGQARHAEQLDRIANRAQRWLVAEPPRPLQEIGHLVDRAARRDRRAPAIAADHAALVELDLDELDLARISLCRANLVEVSLRRADATA